MANFCPWPQLIKWQPTNILPQSHKQTREVLKYFVSFFIFQNALSAFKDFSEHSELCIENCDVGTTSK